MTTPTHLSPRQLADALGVSESSVKRWADKGEIETERTAGGHRRMPWPAVLRFLRASEMSLEKPEVLGLMDREAARQPGEAVVAALVEGDGEALRSAVFHLYAAGTPAAEICDDYLAAAFTELGDRWQHGSLEVYEERRAVAVCQGVLHELNTALPEVGPGAPRAAGGTLAGDWYSLPTDMVQVALRERGWNALSYGSNLPVETLQAAIEEEELRLLWLSISWMESEDRLVDSVSELHATANAHGTALVLGGRELDSDLRRRLRCSAFCDDLAQLIGLADALVPRTGDDH